MTTPPRGTDGARLAGEIAARSYAASTTLDELDRTKRAKQITSHQRLPTATGTPFGLTNIVHPELPDNQITLECDTFTAFTSDDNR